jgi:pimeloyl-ACP methyl ester carboxylesterase
MEQNLAPYKNAASRAAYLAAYDAILQRWPVASEALDAPTTFGTTHITASGPHSAPPLLLLPGNDDSSISWLHSIAALSAAHRVYALDTVGEVGRSTVVHAPSSRAEFAEWLLAVLDRLQLPRADFMGISYGGFLAANFALAHPERVRRLALLCPGLPFAPFSFQWGVRGLPMMLFPSRGSVRWFLRGAALRAPQGDPVLEAFVTGMLSIRPAAPLRPGIADEEWRSLQMPVLLMIGDHEILYDPHRALARAKQLIPQIQVELVKDAGHFLISDQADRVNAAVLSFLEAKEKESIS